LAAHGILSEAQGHGFKQDKFNSAVCRFCNKPEAEHARCYACCAPDVRTTEDHPCPGYQPMQDEVDFATEQARTKGVAWHVLHAALQVCDSEAERRRYVPGQPSDPHYGDFRAAVDDLRDCIAALDKEGEP